ncbi:MAG: hypothetical protein H6681_01225 [Desulfobacteraceae bacterium]|nr:hypothetical protein [Desulfobacteraceae bacterium]
MQLKPIEVLYVVSEDPMYIGFSKAHPNGKSLAEKFGKALKEMKTEGFIDEIIKKYQ